MTTSGTASEMSSCRLERAYRRVRDSATCVLTVGVLFGPPTKFVVPLKRFPVVVISLHRPEETVIVRCEPCSARSNYGFAESNERRSLMKKHGCFES